MERTQKIGVAMVAPVVLLVALLSFAVSAGAATNGLKRFGNNNAIFIPADRISGDTGGPARPYGSGIRVAGFKRVTDVDVTLHSANHTDPDDMDVLLVGPTGRNAIVMSDAGGSNDLIQVGQPWNGVITLDDEAQTFLPDSGQIVTPGRYKPSNYEFGETWPAPAPNPSGNRLLSTFDNTNPTGVWRLYVNDDTAQPDTGDRNGTGVIAGGWSLTVRGVCQNPDSNRRCEPR